MRFAKFDFGNGGPVSGDNISAGKGDDGSEELNTELDPDDLFMVDDNDFVMVEDFDSDAVSLAEEDDVIDDELGDEKESFDEADVNGDDGKPVSELSSSVNVEESVELSDDGRESKSGVSSVVGVEPVNPFLVEDGDEDEELLYSSPVSVRVVGDSESVEPVAESVGDHVVRTDSQGSSDVVNSDTGNTAAPSSVVNPFLDEEDYEEEGLLEKNGLGDDSSSTVPAGVVNSDGSDGVLEGSEIFDADVSGGSSSDVSMSDSVSSPSSISVGDLVEKGVFVNGEGDEIVPGGSFDSNDGSATVVIERKSSRKMESGFKRRNVSEVVVDKPSDSVSDSVVSKAAQSGSIAAQSGSVEKKRYSYARSNGKMNGAELEFFRNLGVKKSDMDSERVKAIRGRVDGAETRNAKKARDILYAQAVGGSELLKRGSKFRFSEKDRDVLQFLALFRYAKDVHVAQMSHCAVGTARNRLNKLRKYGLVLNHTAIGSGAIWFLTEAGMMLSGSDLARVSEDKVSVSMFPHQFTVNHVASNLWGGGVNVLQLDDFPNKNRVNEKGVPVFGESLVSELEIQSSLGKMRGFEKAEVFAPELRSAAESAFGRWERKGGVSFGLSPEFEFGNEFMWALTPPRSLSTAYHVPDLVVKRPRNEDGSPNSIAVEIEIYNKDFGKYEKTLNAYKFDERLYKKVIWVCKNSEVATKLEKAARSVGLWQSGRIGIVPILTSEGVFSGKNLATL